MNRLSTEDLAPRALFLCPTFPQRSGNGLAMRAALWLRFLAGRYSLTVAVLPLAAGRNSAMPAELSALCTEVEIARPSFYDRVKTAIRRCFVGGSTLFEREWMTESVIRKVHAILLSRQFDLIVVHRLYLTPALKTFLAGTVRACTVILDLDDIESMTNRSLADLCLMRGDTLAAAQYVKQAEWYGAQEREWLPLYDQIVVCSDRDSGRVRREYGVKAVAVVPNAAWTESASGSGTTDADSAIVPATSVAEKKFTFVFVGNFNYFPNRDAVQFFTEAILPYLRCRAPGPFEVYLVGSGLSATTGTCGAGSSEVHVVGEVSSVAPYYRMADAIVVPLRAGGGTRIKILEAFAFERPVVTTTVGIEGISAEHEREALIADDPEDFAAQCCRLMESPDLSRQLTSRSKTLYQERYTEAVAFARMSDLITPGR